MTVINITRFRIPALILSSLAILVFWSYTLFGAKGFDLGIDLSAGINMTVDVPSAPDEDSLRLVLDDLNPRVQTGGETGRYIIRIANTDSSQEFQNTTVAQVQDQLGNEFGSVTLVGQEFIGSGIATRLARQTIWLTLVALVLILCYIWIRFRLNYAVSAITAIFHDVLFLVGFIGVMQLEVSTATIAAVLTIIGYSLNDTIVIFDRIRENARQVKDESFNHVINLSVSQSMSRTLITSLTTLLAVIAIMIFATGAIAAFALSLAVGILVGTYSSIFVASPILLAWHDRAANRLHKEAVKAEEKVLPDSGSDTGSQDSGVKIFQQKSEPVARQTAQEIAEATRARAKARARKKKKKK